MGVWLESLRPSRIKGRESAAKAAAPRPNLVRKLRRESDMVLLAAAAVAEAVAAEIEILLPRHATELE